MPGRVPEWHKYEEIQCIVNGFSTGTRQGSEFPAAGISWYLLAHAVALNFLLLVFPSHTWEIPSLHTPDTQPRAWDH